MLSKHNMLNMYRVIDFFLLWSKYVLEFKDVTGTSTSLWLRLDIHPILLTFYVLWM